MDETQIRIGRRLAVKLLNASKFVLGIGADPGADLGAGTAPGTAMASVTAPIDRAMLGRLAAVTRAATAALAAPPTGRPPCARRSMTSARPARSGR